MIRRARPKVAPLVALPDLSDPERIPKESASGVESPVAVEASPAPSPTPKKIPHAEDEDLWRLTLERAEDETWENDEGHPFLEAMPPLPSVDNPDGEVQHSVDELVEQLPVSTREALDHYLRGKFIAVKKLDRQELL